MKLLLDTHLLLWVAGEPARVPAQARALIENPRERIDFQRREPVGDRDEMPDGER